MLILKWTGDKGELFEDLKNLAVISIKIQTKSGFYK